MKRSHLCFISVTAFLLGFLCFVFNLFTIAPYSELEKIRQTHRQHHDEPAVYLLYTPQLANVVSSPIVKHKFSVIIPTYKRMKLLTKVLNNYCSLSSHIDAIFVVWNDLETEIPAALNEFKCAVTIFVKKEKVNSLHNRFLPFPEIKTEAVLSADDDLLISHEDLKFQFKTWKVFKNLLVGFAARRHEERPPGSGKYAYISHVTHQDPRYSFILTTCAMFHVKYLEMYQKELPSELREFIDVNMNCEDILINVIIAQHLRNGSNEQLCPALLVEQKNITMIEKENVGYKGLWHRKEHKSVREDCFSLIAKHFEGIPFNYSELKVSRIFPDQRPVKIS